MEIQPSAIYVRQCDRFDRIPFGGLKFHVNTRNVSRAVNDSEIWKFNGQNMVHFILPTNKSYTSQIEPLLFIHSRFVVSLCVLLILQKYHVTLNGLPSFFIFIQQSYLLHISHSIVQISLCFPGDFILHSLHIVHTQNTRLRFQTHLHSAMNRFHWIQMDGDPFFRFSFWVKFAVCSMQSSISN